MNTSSIEDCWSEDKPKNSITHLGSETHNFASFAHERVDGGVYPVRGVVLVYLWCIDEGHHTFFLLTKRNFYSFFDCNSREIHSHKHISILKCLVLLETFRTLSQERVVHSIEDCLRWRGERNNHVWPEELWERDSRVVRNSILNSQTSNLTQYMKRIKWRYHVFVLLLCITLDKMTSFFLLQTSECFLFLVSYFY